MSKFTQEQLEDMSDLTLNMVVASHFYGNINTTISQSKDDIGSVWVNYKGCILNTNYNPCLDWSDCGELIEGLELEGGVLEISYSYTSLCTGKDLYITVHNDTIKRSVTMLYILAKQGS